MKTTFLLIMITLQCLFTQDAKQTYDTLVKLINNGDLKSVQTLLKKPISFSYAPKDQSSLLTVAVNAKQYDMVKLFVKKGADLNSMEGGFQGTPIMYAAYNNDITMVDLLIDLGADIEKRDGSYGDPAINWAAYAGYTDMVKHLLDKGASPYFIGHGNALDIAFRFNYEPMIALLSDFMDVTHPQNKSEIAFENAILQKDVQRLEKLLSDGFNPNRLTKYNRPFFHLAVISGDLTIVKMMHIYGAEIDKMDRIGFTALYYAGLKNYPSIVEYLVSNGANVNHKSNIRALKLTPTHLAAIGRSTESFKFLSAYGADFNAKGSTGSTALLWGLFEGDRVNLDFAIEMIKQGADPTIGTESGYTPLNFATGVKHQGLIEAIEAFKASKRIESEKE